MSSIYLHIPYCRQACHYCDFHFSTGQHDIPEMVNAMEKEIAIQKDYLQGEPLQSIYFGGGTPSLIDPSLIRNLIQTIGKFHPVSPDAEITLEANPDDITSIKLDAWLAMGINRLSIGIQSFDDALLAFLNRAHNGQAAKDSLALVKEAGFSNISLDLMYGLPGLTLERWKHTLAEALAFRPAHWSAYALTIEDRTVFGQWKKHGRMKVSDEESVALQFEMLMDTMTASGYEQYEISNFCLPGHYARHNSGYWKQVRYLGIGPSAHSFNGDSRQHNVRNNAVYVRSLMEDKLPFEREILTRENKINEYILTTLRTQWGCDLNWLKENLGYDAMQMNRIYLNDLLKRGLAQVKGSTFTLTRKGRLLADKIAEDLMIPA